MILPPAPATGVLGSARSPSYADSCDTRGQPVKGSERSLSDQTFLYVLFIALVVLFFVGRALWRAWATSRVRRAAIAATPAVEKLEMTIATFHARFPVPAAVRLPMDPEDYPEPKPRKPSPPRRRSRPRRRSSYRGRRW